MKAYNRKRKPKHVAKSKMIKCQFFTQVKGKNTKCGFASFRVVVKNLKESFVNRYGTILIMPRYLNRVVK